MSKIYKSVTELVGRTPLLEITNYEKAHDIKARILVKIEYFNPNQSVKDRTALGMIEAAEKDGRLKKGDTIIEVTSGNTGIGLAAIAAAKGYKFRVYLPDNASIERFKAIKALGGQTVKMSEVPVAVKTLEETGGDFMAAVKAIKAQVEATETDIFFTDQSTNLANAGIHVATTGPEIWEDTDGDVDILVAGVGTGGTISGTGRFLRSKKPDIKIIAIQPGPGSLPSEENPEPDEIAGVHPFEGVPESFVPASMDMSIYDEKFEVENYEAFAACRELAKLEGILVGPSSGAAVHTAAEIAKIPENAGKTIVAILPDTGLRYLSTNLFDE